MGTKESNQHESIYLLLIRHCRMYLFGATGSPELRVNEVARDFYTFALLHLVCTMFITTDKKGQKQGGIFHRLLDPIGKGDLLIKIDETLASPVGNTTLKQFIRTKRNLLATHGNLSFNSQPESIQEITNSEDGLNEYFNSMRQLDIAVNKLYSDLKRLATGLNKQNRNHE